MSRSNPQDTATPNPATRWFEWNGAGGSVRYYDKVAKKTVDVGKTFHFVLLDQLASVGGYHEPSKSRIYSNQVRDTTKESLLVRAFNGGELAEGFYRDIKAHITSRGVGGYFVANCYLAFKDATAALALGVIQFKGASLGAWVEFAKDNRDGLYTKSVRITGFTEDKKGAITFRVPVFKLEPITKEMDLVAKAIDAELQQYLKSYLRRNTREQVAAPAQHEEVGVTYDREDEPPPPNDGDVVEYEDEVPF